MVFNLLLLHPIYFKHKQILKKKKQCVILFRKRLIRKVYIEKGRMVFEVRKRGGERNKYLRAMIQLPKAPEIVLDHSLFICLIFIEGLLFQVLC